MKLFFLSFDEDGFLFVQREKEEAKERGGWNVIKV